MRLRHEPADGSPRVLASEVETADTVVSQALGLMFRRSISDDYALVFEPGRARRRGLHMLFVPFPIDALWLVDGEVTEVARLRAWVGHGSGLADTLVELPAGAAGGVAVGDRVRLVDEDVTRDRAPGDSE